VALYTAAIANGGTIFRPFLVRKIRSQEGRSLKYTSIEAVHQLSVSQQNLALIRDGMRDAVYGEDGTAENARNTYITVAGKTGTAELGSGEKKITWFTGFAPVDNPEYALVVMIEDGVSGGRTSAPVASRFFENWFRLRQ
jgi:penicillin-binding protein 2